MKKIEECSCHRREIYGVRFIKFCPFHKAAPELLAALQQCSGYIESTNPEYGARYIRMAEQAIAKAEGNRK